MLCPFCRTPSPVTVEDYVDRLNKRAEGNDATAIRQLGGHYDAGDLGFPRNLERALEFWLRAGELGDVTTTLPLLISMGMWKGT